jgi:hypothetical protein
MKSKTPKLIGAKKQLCDMYEIGASTGTSTYDAIRSELFDSYSKEYGREGFECQPIPKDDVEKFKAWIESEED